MLYPSVTVKCLLPYHTPVSRSCWLPLLGLWVPTRCGQILCKHVRLLGLQRKKPYFSPPCWQSSSWTRGGMLSVSGINYWAKKRNIKTNWFIFFFLWSNEAFPLWPAMLGRSCCRPWRSCSRAKPLNSEETVKLFPRKNVANSCFDSLLGWCVF